MMMRFAITLGCGAAARLASDNPPPYQVINVHMEEPSAGGLLASFLQFADPAATAAKIGQVATDAGLVGEIRALGTAVDAGGATAEHALIRLNTLVAEKAAKSIMQVNGTMGKAKQIMQREETPDYVRGLAGSLLTKITDLPVISEISDVDSGSYGHVNVVLPAPSRVYAGDARGSGLSFMETIPVDGQKIRNSLWLTQVLRSPAQATINAGVHEDIGALQTAQRYEQMEERAAVLSSH